jgi:hypothetical protein
VISPPSFETRLDQLLNEAVSTAPRLADDALRTALSFHETLSTMLRNELTKRKAN